MNEKDKKQPRFPRLHALAHLLGLNLRRSIAVASNFPNLRAVHSECLTCGERGPMEELVVEGHGNTTFFPKNGREEGYTYDRAGGLGRGRY